jgi:hypothetical protein
MVNARSSQSGVVLIAVVFLAFVVSITLAALARLWETDAQRDKERELRWAGRQFGKALGSYALVTPEGQLPMPKTLDELLLDTRVDPPMRHLRRIPLDPMTGKSDWGMVRTAGGAITAVHSSSHAKPLEADGVWPEDRALASVKEYSQWLFGPISMQRSLVVPLVEPAQSETAN